MKQILPILACVLLFVQCEKKSSATESQKTAADSATTAPASIMEPSPSLTQTLNCNYLDTLSGLTLAKQVVWLKQNQTQICDSDTLKLCITDLHHMKQTDFDQAVVAYWGSGVQPKSTVFTLSQLLQGNTCGYDYYLVFDADLEENIYFKKENYFSSLLTSYSIPFIQGLQARYSLNGNSKLKFTKGKVNGQVVIMITVEGQSDANFDYSHYPGGNTTAA